MYYKAPRGTQDILPEDQAHWRYVIDKAGQLAHRFGYQRIDTPVFEQAGLFVRTVGEGTDIVEKETYTFRDRGDEEVTLRPEGTAPICRAYLEKGMHSLPQPVRLFYFSPIFRYERPQSGRFRQHHQFGVEAIGDSNPAVDAEVIQLGWEFTKLLGLENLDLLLNTIGDSECRPIYLNSLRDYYHQPVLEGLVCPDCELRYERNVLRMLDCKRTDFSCQVLGDQAPASFDHLCENCKTHWETLTNHLHSMHIPFQTSHRLVRGLDYYTKTVFEIQPNSERGAQNTILAGGRYDGLIQELGGVSTPGIGFGSGIERLILNIKRQKLPVPFPSRTQVTIITLSQESVPLGLTTASDLRRKEISVVLAPPSRSLRGQMRFATSMNSRFVVIIGEDEINRGTLTLKDMDSGEQSQIPENELSELVVSQTKA